VRKVGPLFIHRWWWKTGNLRPDTGDRELVHRTKQEKHIFKKYPMRSEETKTSVVLGLRAEGLKSDKEEQFRSLFHWRAEERGLLFLREKS
jgi:hypothetical protein